MGSGPSVPKGPFVTKLAAEREGESEIYRSTKFNGEMTTSYYSEVRTLYDNFQRGLSVNPHGNCMGWRVNDGPFQWRSYSQVWELTLQLGAGLVHIGVEKYEKYGIYSKNTPEWSISENAANAYSNCIVPLYDTLGDEAVEYILNQAELKVVICSADKTAGLLALAGKTPTLKTIIQYEEADQEQRDKAAEAGITLYSFAEVVAKGKETPVPVRPPKGDDVQTICYTSGTTGLPKGVMLTHTNWIADSTGVLYHGLTLTKDDVHISYLPLAHVFERLLQAALYLQGGSFGFYRGDVLKLFDDIAELKPTIFASVPRLYNRLYDKVMAGMKEATGLKATLISNAWAAKKEGLKTHSVTHAVWDKLVFSKIAAKLGGNVRIMVTGSAPISAEVKEFLRICFSVEILEGYGQTECVGVAAVTPLGMVTSGHVGIPLPCNEIKLVDLPEMDYYSTDKPYPRGEVLYRGANVSQGYFKNEEKTKEAFTEDGWLRSGDVGQIDDQGFLKIIDRAKNIFKLAQGEYVAPEKIEMVFARSAYVAQSFIFGDSLKSQLVAIIIPDFEICKPWAEGKKVSAEPADLIKNEDLRKTILDDVTKLCKESNLKGFEFVKAIALDSEPFSVENDTLTPTFKMKRPQAQRKYQEEIDGMYKSLETPR